MKFVVKKLVFIISIILSCSQVVYAESAKSLELDIRGVSKDRVSARFGQPDREVLGRGGQEMWFYDKSVVFFASSKVVAWTHPEDLLEREVESFDPLTSLESSGVVRKATLGMWVNEWTLRKDPKSKITLSSKSKILKELIN